MLHPSARAVDGCTTSHLLPANLEGTQPVRHDIAMSGEITIMGKVLGVGGIQLKLMAAIDAGVKSVILPAENERDVLNLPDYVRTWIDAEYATDIQQVLALAITRAVLR